MNESLENDGLWQLLGRGSAPDVSPFFARNVLRAIRQSSSSPVLIAIPRWITSLAFAVVIAGFGICLTEAIENTLPTIVDREFHAIFDRIAGLPELTAMEPIGPEEFADF